MNDKPGTITIDRALLVRLASWAAIVIGALLMLWPVTLTVLGTTVTGDPAVLLIFRTGDLLRKVDELSTNPFGALATGPIQTALFWAWVRVLIGAALVLGAVIALLRRRSARRTPPRQQAPGAPA